MRWFLIWSLISVGMIDPAFAQQGGTPPNPVPPATSNPAPSSTSPSATPLSTPSKDTVPKHIMEQYKAYVGDLGSLGSQLATTQTFYLTIVSGLIAVVALKRANRPIEEYFAPVPILVFIVIALVCRTWWLTAESFNSLFAAKFSVLRNMERDFHDLYPMFKQQTEQYGPTHSIIGDQSWLIHVIGIGALFIAVGGIIWQIRNWLVGKTQ